MSDRRIESVKGGTITPTTGPVKIQYPTHTTTDKEYIVFKQVVEDIIRNHEHLMTVRDILDLFDEDDPAKFKILKWFKDKQ